MNPINCSIGYAWCKGSGSDYTITGEQCSACYNHWVANNVKPWQGPKGVGGDTVSSFAFADLSFSAIADLVINQFDKQSQQSIYELLYANGCRVGRKV